MFQTVICTSIRSENNFLPKTDRLVSWLPHYPIVLFLCGLNSTKYALLLDEIQCSLLPLKLLWLLALQKVEVLTVNEIVSLSQEKAKREKISSRFSLSLLCECCGGLLLSFSSAFVLGLYIKLWFTIQKWNNIKTNKFYLF